MRDARLLLASPGVIALLSQRQARTWNICFVSRRTQKHLKFAPTPAKVDEIGCGLQDACSRSAVVRHASQPMVNRHKNGTYFVKSKCGEK